MTVETVFTRARLVLPDQVVEGSLVSADGRIVAFGPGPSASAGVNDLEGDLLIPGIIDLHTDNLERQVQPRINARWPSRSAMIAHDAQCAGAGVTPPSSIPSASGIWALRKIENAPSSRASSISTGWPVLIC